MRRRAALICVAAAIGGCGGTTATGPAAGCRGLATAEHSTSFLAVFGAVNRLNRRYLCTRFGRPTAITHSGELVVWHYGSATFKFNGKRIVGGGDPSERYSVGYPTK